MSLQINISGSNFQHILLDTKFAPYSTPPTITNFFSRRETPRRVNQWYPDHTGSLNSVWNFLPVNGLVNVSDFISFVVIGTISTTYLPTKSLM